MSAKRENSGRVRRATVQRTGSAKKARDFESLVREGIERFVLKDATIHDFLASIRSLAVGRNSYSHPLTRAVFSRIVREALKKRSRQRQGSKRL